MDRRSFPGEEVHCRATNPRLEPFEAGPPWGSVTRCTYCSKLLSGGKVIGSYDAASRTVRLLDSPAGAPTTPYDAHRAVLLVLTDGMTVADLRTAMAGQGMPIGALEETLREVIEGGWARQDGERLYRVRAKP